MPLTYEKYTKDDHLQFERLVAQESVTWEGQALKMGLVEALIQERIQKKRVELASKIIAQSAGTSPSAAEQQALDQTPFSLRKIVVRPDMEQCIFGLGDHVRNVASANPHKRNNSLNVFIPAHIDTVEIEKEDLLVLKSDPQNPDIVKGRGVYDMLGPVMNSISMFADLRVPPGMNVFFGFTYDEEKNSEGAKALIKHWDWWKHIDIVLSSEIGHIDVKDGDNSMSYIHGRRGRQKYHVNLRAADQSQGHFAEPHVRSTSQALLQAGALFNQMFYGRRGEKPALQLHHPLFSPEKLEMGDIITSGSPNKPKSGSPTSTDFYYNILSVPERRLNASLLEQRAAFDHISTLLDFPKHGIQASLTENEFETSYEPFLMPPDHPLCAVVGEMLTKIVDSPVRAECAPSVADENLYAAALSRNGKYFPPYRGVISIPPKGGNAHRPDEYVSLGGLAQVRYAIKALIEDGQNGLLQLKTLKKTPKVR